MKIRSKVEVKGQGQIFDTVTSSECSNEPLHKKSLRNTRPFLLESLKTHWLAPILKMAAVACERPATLDDSENAMDDSENAFVDAPAWEACKEKVGIL